MRRLLWWCVAPAWALAVSGWYLLCPLNRGAEIVYWTGEPDARPAA